MVIASPSKALASRWERVCVPSLELGTPSGISSKVYQEPNCRESRRTNGIHDWGKPRGLLSKVGNMLVTSWR